MGAAVAAGEGRRGSVADGRAGAVDGGDGGGGEPAALCGQLPGGARMEIGAEGAVALAAQLLRALADGETRRAAHPGTQGAQHAELRREPADFCGAGALRHAQGF